MRRQQLKNFSVLFVIFFNLFLFPLVLAISESPFSPKAYVRRYWSNRVSKAVPPAEFLLSKASPLTARDTARFARLASNISLSSHLPAFCRSARLLCFPDPAPSLEKHNSDARFDTYSDKNFINYVSGQGGGRDSFKNYSSGENEPTDLFKRYGRDTAGHKEDFTAYAANGNVVSETFTSYAGGATGGKGTFTAYASGANVPGLTFTSYSDDANARGESFSSYSPDANGNTQGFANYGKNGNALSDSFDHYGNNTNGQGSSFAGYSDTGNAASDTFSSYGSFGNVPANTFKGYGNGGNDGVESFKKYRDHSNVGTDTFTSYGKKSNSGEKVNFASYGEDVTAGGSTFTGYGDRAVGQEVGFKRYATTRNDIKFNVYAKEGVTFSQYENTTTIAATATAATSSESKTVIGKKKWVEPGRFFREGMLKEGLVMPMPDIKDKMPPRAFLPRGILSKLPFASSRISELKEIFHAPNNSSMEGILTRALGECERATSKGETKRCVGSVEDMVDFAVSVLGRSVEPRTTRNLNGSKTDIMIGEVKGINGGRVTKSVSCHQSLYPYLLYYCHSVPKVRVYEADILDPKTKERINRGVAICHLDTSSWSATHGAFLALGPGPGKIEVCHWIFENDLTWTVAD